MTAAARFVRSPWQRAAVTAIFVANGLGVGAWAASIPFLKVALALSDGALGLVFCAFVAGAVLAMFGAARLAARIGLANATRVSAALFSASLGLPVFAPGLATLSAAAFAVGIANGLVDVTMNAYAGIVERRWRAAIMSSFHAGFSAGGFTGAALGVALAAWGAPGTLIAAAALGLALVAAAWGRLGDVESAPVVAEPALTAPMRAALPLCAGALLCAVCEGAMADWTGVYLFDVARAPHALAPLGYAAFSAAMVAGRLLGDRFVRRWGRGPVMRRGAGLATLGLALAVFAPSLTTATLGFALVGVGLANFVPAVFSIASGLTAAPAVGVAMAATAGYAGMLGGPAVIGAIAESAGLQIGMGVLIVCAAGAAAVARALRD